MKHADLGPKLTTKRPRKRKFLAQLERAVPWAALVELVSPHAHAGMKGRPPFAGETMLRIHFMQQWFTLSEPAVKEALHDIVLFREFAGPGYDSPLPDESTILRFRHLLERHQLAKQMLGRVNELLRDEGPTLKAITAVDATQISALSSTKNASGERDPEMHQAKKGNQLQLDMKAHIGGDAKSALVQTARGTAANVNDVVGANSLLHGVEADVFADAGYQGAAERPDARGNVTWRVAMRPGKRRTLDNDQGVDRLIDEIERLQAIVRSKVEHPPRVIKRQFGHIKVRYRGLKKNTAQLNTLFAPPNLGMARARLLVTDGQIRL